MLVLVCIGMDTTIFIWLIDYFQDREDPEVISDDGDSAWEDDDEEEEGEGPPAERKRVNPGQYYMCQVRYSATKGVTESKFQFKFGSSFRVQFSVYQ